ncbi:MAG TPA: class I SAM-dependent methyltransferase [Pirellulales bacterium]
MDAAGVVDQSLAECLDMLRRTFDLERIAGQRIFLPDVAEYYQQSDAAYRLFHSSDGALHLALNRDGSFDPAGYYAHAEIVERQIGECAAERILEAGSGNGFNTLYLARKHPGRQFVGVDLTGQHVAGAREAAHGATNLEYVEGNYESLDFAGGAFDVAFGVETFCQTDDMRRALTEMHRVLRPGGRLVVIDCFRQRPLDEFDADLQLAAKLVEKTTAVDGFAVISQWLDLARSIGFTALEVDDESAHVVHNLARLYRLARGFFDDPALVETVRETVPPLMLQNAICGLLMPYTVGGGAHGYYRVALAR